MARIIYGPIITDIKGSIGGMTFQKNGSGTIARLKPRKTKTNTQKQRDQQPRLKQVQAAWNLLTLINKVLWNDFAAANKKIGLNGHEKKLTGYQWFLSINENRLLFDDSILSVPPVYEIVNPIDSLNFNIVNNKLYLAYNTPIVYNDYYSGLYISFITNSKSKFDFNNTRLIKTGFSSGNTSNYINDIAGLGLWSDYYKYIFPPELRNKSFYLMAFMRFIGLSSGISSLAYTTISKFVWDGTKYVIE